MEQHRIKLWIGLGSYLLASASPLGLSAADRSDPSHYHGPSPVLLADSGHGGEGGEGGEGGALAGATEDQRYAVRLLLAKGHFRAGSELARLGRWSDARDHFLHPEAELFPGLKNDFKARNVAGLEASADRLAEAAEAGDPAWQERYREALAGIDGALAKLDGWAGAAPRDVLPVALMLLHQAGAEYREAVADGRVVNAHEYQDGRGFWLVAADLVDRLSDKVAAGDRDAYRQVRATLDGLGAAWPAITPPDRPLPVSRVLADISRVELAASRIR